MTAKTSSTNTMHIGELAKRTGLSLRTIRHYDDVGLLPATARTDGGFRVFSEEDFERLMVIKQMKPWVSHWKKWPRSLASLPPRRARNLNEPGRWRDSWSGPSIRGQRWRGTWPRPMSSSKGLTAGPE